MSEVQSQIAKKIASRSEATLDELQYNVSLKVLFRCATNLKKIIHLNLVFLTVPLTGVHKISCGRWELIAIFIKQKRAANYTFL